jgi:uncharacterized repeat protein (TIGR03833 family)
MDVQDGVNRRFVAEHKMKTETHPQAGTRSGIRPGMRVFIIQKQDQPTGRLTEGIISEILTRSAVHPHGIKVRLVDGRVGRVQEILD